MSTVDEFADSTDWLLTPLSALTPLESSLRCQVCKDFFTTPMITSCSHTFCSLCIRRYLSQEGRCPACREQDQEMKLRRNWVVEELVTNFRASRKSLLDFARSAAKKSEEDALVDSGPPRKRRKVVKVNANLNGAERRSTRSQTKQIISSQTSVQTVRSSQGEVEDSDEGSVYEDVDPKPAPAPAAVTAREPNDGLVSCPCCGRRMKETIINSHLDSCINGNSTVGVDNSSSPVPSGPVAPVEIAYNQTKPSKSKDRLPFINYSLLNDNALRKKLKELGISFAGSKDLMRKRHTEWVNLWNANCDSLNPVTKRQLLNELERWERTLGRQVDKGPSGVMVKDFDRDGYAKTQKSNFDDLIAKAREKRALAKASSPEVNPTTSSTPAVTDAEAVVNAAPDPPPEHDILSIPKADEPDVQTHETVVSKTPEPEQAPNSVNDANNIDDGSIATNNLNYPVPNGLPTDGSPAGVLHQSSHSPEKRQDQSFNIESAVYHESMI